MEYTVVEYGEERCLMIASDGPTIGDATGARDLIEAALGERATLVAVPVERLDERFFSLRTGLAGEVIQKMVNYRLKFAVLGDVSSFVAASDSLRDFVVECDRGTDIVFVEDLRELEARLTSKQGESA